MTIGFTIPGPPQGKGRPRFNRATGRAYTPYNTASYENLVKLEYEKAAAGRRFGDKKEVSMQIHAYFAIPESAPAKSREKMLKGIIAPVKKPDADNILKVVCDSLNGVCYRDDSQVVAVAVQKLYAEIPRVEVFIWDEEE